MKNLIMMSAMLLTLMLLNACKKQWLDAKPDKSLVIPSSVGDYQAILDDGVTNFNWNQPSLFMDGDGDFHVTDSRYGRLPQWEQSTYVWAATNDNFYGGFPASDWVNSYKHILNANIVLDGMKTLKVPEGSESAARNVVGSALFYRSFDFYNLSQEFCKPYNPATAATDLGLVLRTSSDVNVKLGRATVQQTYDQIIKDLLAAEAMLPVTPEKLTRPSRPAVFALLSRLYLSQQNYDKAFLYADSCLQLRAELMDFNSLDPSADYPIGRFNKEVIFHSALSHYSAFSQSRLIVDSVLYHSFSANDLRAVVYFAPGSGTSFSYRGSYNGDNNFFGGLTTDEMYINRAECYARAGNTIAAMADLNTLLRTRWASGTYIDMTAPNPDAALAIVLTERRKELCFRSLRWSDLRRLNTDPRFQVTLTRVVNGQTYTLPPNSPRYVLPIDATEIQLGGLQQNPR